MDKSDDSPSSIDVGLLVIRLVFGLILAFAHGLGKIPPSEKFVGGVEEMGLPLPLFLAWCAALAEALGGLFLALGLLTRPTSFFIAVTMAVAGFLRHANDPFKIKELAFLYLAVAIAFMFTGSGKLGLDAVLRRRLKKTFL